MEIPLLLFAVACFAMCCVGVKALSDIRDTSESMTRILARELSQIHHEAASLKHFAKTFATDFTKVADHVIPKPPKAPTTEDKVENVQRQLHEMEKFFWDAIQKTRETDLAKRDCAAPTEAAAQVNPTPVAAPVDLSPITNGLAGVSENLKILAQATEANGQALGWLVNFVKNANPKAAAMA